MGMGTLAAAPPDELRRKVWTRDELAALVDTGVLGDRRCELIEGEVYDKMGQKPQHSAAIARLTDLLVGLFAGARVSVQSPVQVALWEERYSEPEPDLAVLHGPRSSDHHPGPHEVLFLVEVADTSLRMDLGRKANLYARAGYAEYLVLNLAQQLLHVLRSPVEGTYTDVRVLTPADTYTPLGAPDVQISVADLF